MNFKVKTTPKFEKDIKHLAKKYPSLKHEYIQLVKALQIEPHQGQSLGHNCYKIRLSIASKGKGKSGGARVITYLQIKERNVFLLTIYDKSEQETISNKELPLLMNTIE